MVITHTVGAVLAGGFSRRMGRDKASLILDGSTFLDRVFGAVSGVVSEVTVYGGSIVPTDGILLQDDRPGEGPVGGLLTAMRRSRGRPVLVVSVDTPMITPDVLRSIIEPVVPSDGVRVAFAEGRIHPLVAVYGSNLLPIVQSRFDSGMRSVLGVIDDVERVVEVEVDAEAVFNVNTEEEYQQIVERYGL
jgi:molybdopterin-guanine dinucleotide biosynthesis protein A